MLHNAQKTTDRIVVCVKLHKLFVVAKKGIAFRGEIVYSEFIEKIQRIFHTVEHGGQFYSDKEVIDSSQSGQ
ncbi:hypothetical protein [Ethanoligenens harbinense]|uniref:hypothetical protein n=1 Tax=Ethanoligenens harbinense TaxID=253239 RepID=UPI00031BB253|nr:hypothetical protein [Ethanoligenens harbinense]AVQ96179.1 hypothetical protein CXQ68_08045 [Ethanoligenens harbinense YUAN-3]AYF38839.1 hypothetical protein CXP51_07915 [Ethanoligenens harbinense]AYF41589.1 hypothetical protein CN246_08060 [Ethanoligenens harbinense]QCN92420.1 hypothetical protein DRA42_08075 [Ethanoligenens harbinense]